MKYVIVLFLILFWFAHGIAQDGVDITPSGVYFEGEVSFKIYNSSLDLFISDSDVEDYFGDHMVGVVAEDFYKVTSTRSGKDSVIVYYHLLDDKVYYDDRKKDTIFWSPLSKEPGRLISLTRNKMPKKEVLGEERESVTIEYEVNGRAIKNFEGTFYFHPDYRLKKSSYKGHKMDFWNLFVNETGSISIRNEVYARPLYHSIYEAYKIERRTVLQEEFDMDPNKPVVRGG